MKIKINSHNIFFIYIFVYIFFITFGTGIHSDDWNILNNNKNLKNYIFDEGGSKFLLNIITFLIYYFEFKFIGLKNFFIYDLIKAIIIYFTFFSCYLFLINFYEAKLSIFLSLIFVLLPTHDSTIFWVMGQYTLIAFAFLFLSFHFFLNDRQKYIGLIFGFLGIFTGYGSPPILLGLSVIFLLQKKYKIFFIFLIPLFFYLTFYSFISFNSSSSDFRLNILNTENLLSLIIKNYCIQLFSFIDANIGPSFLLKFSFGIFNNNLFSIFLTLPFLFFLKNLNFFDFSPKNIKILLFSSILIVLSSLFVFSITGKYPQISFGLGNRVTIYGSLFFVVFCFMLLNFLKSNFLIYIFISLVLFSVSGTSNHWKSWNIEQMKLFNFLSDNKSNYYQYRNSLLFVEGMQYSNFYFLDHIDTFATSSVTPFFNLATNLNFRAYGINDNLKISKNNNFVINKKYNIKYPINDKILIFSISKKKFYYINKKILNQKINENKITRHWLKLNNFTYIKKTISFFSNRYRNHFDEK